MKGYYWTCPYCGANLDSGEKCDCNGYKRNAIRMAYKVRKKKRIHY